MIDSSISYAEMASLLRSSMESQSPMVLLFNLDSNKSKPQRLSFDGRRQSNGPGQVCLRVSGTALRPKNVGLPNGSPRRFYTMNELLAPQHNVADGSHQRFQWQTFSQPSSLQLLWFKLLLKQRGGPTVELTGRGKQLGAPSLWLKSTRTRVRGPTNCRWRRYQKWSGRRDLLHAASRGMASAQAHMKNALEIREDRTALSPRQTLRCAYRTHVILRQPEI